MGLDQYIQIRTAIDKDELTNALASQYSLVLPFTPVDTIEKLKDILNQNNLVVIDTDYDTLEWATQLINGEWDANDIEHFYQDAKGVLVALVIPQYAHEELYYYRKFNALQNYFEEKE